MSGQGETGMQPEAGKPAHLGRAYVLVLIAVLLLYAVSMAPGVLWQDSGLAQIRVLQRDLFGHLGLALSHPLYYLLAIAFQILPAGESAFKTNLVSVLFGAVTVANVFLFVRLVTGRYSGALIGAVSLAVTHTFWQHCALAEVYTVSTALLSTELLCVCQYAADGRPRWLALLFLANGLGISNHMLAALSLACYGVLVIALIWQRRLRPVMLLWLALLWLVGAGLYGGLILAELVRGEALGSVIRSALFGRVYAENVLNVLPGTRQLANSVLILGLNFPTPAVLLLIPGLVALRRHRRKRLSATIIALLLVHLIWAVRYDVPDQYTFFIPSLVLLAVLIGLGAARFLAGRSRAWPVVLALGVLLPAGIYALLPALARSRDLGLGLSRTVPYRDEYTYFLCPWKTGYRGPERFALELRETLPERAVLIADSTVVRPLHYLQLTGRWRSDLSVFPPPDRPSTEDWRTLEQRLSDELAAGLVFVVTPHPRYCPKWLCERYEFVREGLVYRVAGPKAEQPASSRPADAP